MAQSELTIDLGAICANWRALQGKSSAPAGAVVKANAYGLNANVVAPALAKAGAQTFFVAIAEEGVAVRKAVGPEPTIFVFGGHMAGDARLLQAANLTPLLNSIDQMLRHVERLPKHPFGIQLDTGMNRLGMEVSEWQALRDLALSQSPALIMSHLACADEPNHPMNKRQLRAFHEMTDGISAPRSLSATGGILLGADYHFDMTRPGIGMYGGLPYDAAQPVVSLQIPVIQVRDVVPGETVGYGNTWVASRTTKVATIAAGYADGLLRAMGPKATLWHKDTACQVLGRVSMDLIGVDVSALENDPDRLDLLGPQQGVDVLADWAGTIGYEILTSLGGRYARRYVGA